MHRQIAAAKTYYATFAALAALTVLTVLLSFVELGAWHTPVGLGIATIKALLVALIFMHLLHSGRLAWLAILAGLFWLGILMGLTLTDYLTRVWLVY